MFTQARRAWAAALALAALLTARPALRAQAPGEPPPVPTEDQINPPPAPRPGEPPPVPDGAVLPQERGPVHEAFAVPADKAPVAGPVVPRQPPAPVPEVPPDQRPEGDNLIWVPGYWGWDAGRNDYVWVSGCWRVPPPGRRWVPGSWARANGQWQWVSGFWAPAGQQQWPYLPPPPESLEVGPTTPAPDDNSYYVPGCWLYRDNGYVWRPGCWAPCRPGWVWVPASYCATPSGDVFVGGYWDYPLANRGLLFAPVCFNGAPWTAPGWCYQPSYCVGLGGLLSSLWVGPSRGCYFFGNYFGPRYRGLGFTPWLSAGGGHANPLSAYYRWANRGSPGWYAGLAGAYRGGVGQPPLVRPLGFSPRLTRLSPAQPNRYRAFGQRFAAAGPQRQGRPAALPLAHAAARAPHRAAGPAHVRPSYGAFGRSPAVTRGARPFAQPNHAPAAQPHRAAPRPALVQHGPPRHTPPARPAAPHIARPSPPHPARRPAAPHPAPHPPAHSAPNHHGGGHHR